MKPTWSKNRPKDGQWCWYRYRTPGHPWKEKIMPIFYRSWLFDGVGEDKEFEFSVILYPVSSEEECVLEEHY